MNEPDGLPNFSIEDLEEPSFKQPWTDLSSPIYCDLDYQPSSPKTSGLSVNDLRSSDDTPISDSEPEKAWETWSEARNRMVFPAVISQDPLSADTVIPFSQDMNVLSSIPNNREFLLWWLSLVV